MKYKDALLVKKILIYAIMIILTLIAIVPIYLMLINATRSNAQINSGVSFIPGDNAIVNWHILTGRGFKIFQGFGNSLIIAGLSTILNVYFSAMTAYGLHVYEFRGRKFLWSLILVLIMLPATLSFIGFYQFMASLHLLDSYIPLIIPAMAAPPTVLFIKQYLESILSRELIDAGRIDGASELNIFNVIMLPIMTPALATQCIFSFVGSWNNFMTPFVLLSSVEKYTLPMLVQNLRGDIYRTEFGGIYLGIAIALLPILVFYAFMSRFIIAGISMGGVKE